jgi:ATP-binding cassette subfamily B (MDR/TAP) protein 1
MANPGKEHWKAVQWIFRYLHGTSNACLQFGHSKIGLVGYVDSDYAGDLDKRRSLTGYLFTIGGCVVSWKARLQATVTLSTTEAGYMAISEACKEAIWFRGLYNELCGDSSCTTIFCDSQSAICLTKIKCSMREQSILMLDITLFEVLLHKVISKYPRLVLMTIPQIC